LIEGLKPSETRNVPKKKNESRDPKENRERRHPLHAQYVKDIQQPGKDRDRITAGRVGRIIKVTAQSFHKPLEEVICVVAPIICPIAVVIAQEYEKTQAAQHDGKTNEQNHPI
jgi:hypothetical protein